METYKIILLLFFFVEKLHSLPADGYDRLDNLKASPEKINNLSSNESGNVEKVNVDQVIEEVQSLLQTNPKLPRLTRGEIVELLENITQQDSDNLKKHRGQKAIMLVMPYTPNNPSDNMEELYTKPPITQIIDNGKDGLKKGPQQEIPTFKPLKPSKIENDVNVKEEKFVKQQYFNDELDSLKTEEQRIEIFEQSTAQSTTKSSTTTVTSPTTKATRLTTKRPIRRKPSTPKQRQHYKTTVTSTTPRTTSSLELITQSKLSETPKVRRRPLVTQKPLKIEEITYKPTQLEVSRKTTSAPQHHPNHKYPEEEQEHSHSAEAIKIINAPKLNSKVTKKPEYVQKTTSFVKETTKPDDVLDAIHIPENMKNIVKDLDALMQNGNTKIRPILPNIDDIITTTPTTTGTTKIPDVSEMADNLSPEMRELLMSFGLIPNPNYKPEPFKAPEPIFKQEAEITRDSYISFKPLPANAPTRQEMEELLSEFGLKDSNRDGKSISNNNKNKNNINAEALKGSNKQENVSKKENPQHVFNPKEKPTASPEELDRLEKLLDMIKQLEKLNGNLSEENLKQVDMNKLKDLVDTFNKEESLDMKNAPDPLNYDSGLTKNEVKRQQSSTSITSTTTTTTTEESRNPSLADLEASFGGTSETVSEATLPETTTAKRTGFYYLVDWNSFFDIDNQKGKRVNLRFQPKVGDPRNFLSVTVP